MCGAKGGRRGRRRLDRGRDKARWLGLGGQFGGDRACGQTILPWPPSRALDDEGLCGPCRGVKLSVGGPVHVWERLE